MKTTKLIRRRGLLMIVAAASFMAVTASAAPGDIFVADYGSGSDGSGIIYKYAPDGTPTIFATGLFAPEGLAFDNAGNLFESDNGSGIIYKFPADGGPRSPFSTGLNGPVGLAFDNAGNLFVANYNDGTIKKFTPSGAPTIFATGLNGPYALAFDNAGNLFVANYNDGTIKKYAPDGSTSLSAFATLLTHPDGLAFGSGGDLFVAESSNAIHTIYRFTPDGARFPFATAGLNSPAALVFDNAGNLFAADGLIYIFAPDGTRSTFASGLNFPAALAIQPQPQPTFAAHIQQPINADGTSVFNVKRGVVPVKFTLTQGGVVNCDLPLATIALTRTTGGTTGAIDESVYTGSADAGSNFRIDTCQYVYNLSASALGVGTYRTDIKINGNVIGSATFQLK